MKTILVYLLLALLIPVVGSALAQDQPIVPRVEVDQLTDHLYKLTCIERHEANVVVSAGPDGVLLVDAGYAETADVLKEAIDSLGYLKYIVSTHSHLDHVGGNTTLRGSADLIAHTNTAMRIRGEYFGLKGTNSTCIPNVLVKDSMTIHFNGEDVRILYLPDGHTDGDLIVHFSGSNVVVMADLLFADVFPYVALEMGGTAKGLMENLDRALEMFPGNTTFVPGHGRSYTADDVKEHVAVLKASAQIVKQGIDQGQTVDEMRDARLLSQYSAWDTAAVWPQTTSDSWITYVGAGAGSSNTSRLVSICEPMTYAIVNEGIEVAINKYRHLRKNSSDKYNFGVNQLNRLGYELLARGRVADAIEVFRLNIEVYPDQSNPYDSMGEAYLIHGDTTLAILNYRKSLELDPGNSNAEQILKTLKVKH